MSNLDRTLPRAGYPPAFVSSQPDVQLWHVQPKVGCLSNGEGGCRWIPLQALQSNKPTFGTSDFAVSPVDTREYIDATAEETCPAESVPMSEPQRSARPVRLRKRHPRRVSR